MGGTIGAGTGALLAKLIDTGVPDAKANELREKVTTGTTALALLISHVQPAALNDELNRSAGATVIETNPPDEAVEALRTHAAAWCREVQAGSGMRADPALSCDSRHWPSPRAPRGHRPRVPPPPRPRGPLDARPEDPQSGRGPLARG